MAVTEGEGGEMAIAEDASVMIVTEPVVDDHDDYEEEEGVVTDFSGDVYKEQNPEARDRAVPLLPTPQRVDPLPNSRMEGKILHQLERAKSPR